MSTAFLHRRLVCKARSTCPNAACGPGAARKPRMHYDMRVPSVVPPLRLKALWRNGGIGSGQPRRAQARRSERQRPAQILASGDGFPSFFRNCIGRRAGIRNSLPVFLHARAPPERSLSASPGASPGSAPPPRAGEDARAYPRPLAGEVARRRRDGEGQRDGKMQPTSSITTHVPSGC
jgi:hypothetical protein